MTTRFNYFRAAMVAGAIGVLGFASAQERLAADDMPQNWQYATEFDQTSPACDAWWKGFSDPVLDSLIVQGVDNNYDLAMAARRIEIAKQQLRQTQAAYYPQLSLSGGWQQARNSGMTGNRPAAAVTGSYFDLGVDMQWQVDVFGKVYSRAKAGKAAVNASRADYDAMMVTVAAKIATTYFQLRTLQAQIAVLNTHIASQKRVLEITQARHEAGVASQLDVSQAATTYYSTLASMSALQSSETSAINAIAVLLGVFPSDIDQAMRKPAPLPDYHQIVAVGVPMELLRRRPDVVEAEYTLAQYAAQLGVAKKDFLPTISLSGSIGTSAHKLGDLFGKESLSYAIAPTLSWTLFDGMARSAAAAQAKEQMQIGIDNYNLTLVTAVQEVETAMNAYANDLLYIDNLTKVVEQAQKAFDLSIDLYKQGLTYFINVADSQINLLSYSSSLAAAQGQALADLVNLYQALGGGY